MKRIVLYILAALSGIALSLSCSEKENLERSRFYVSPSSLEFGMDGGSLEVSLTTSAGSWTLTAPENGGWCSADRYSGISSTVITFTAEKNTGDERSAVFTFTSGGTDPLEFTVSQKGDEAMAAFDGETVVPEPSTWDGQKRADISYQALVYSFADGDGDRIGDISGLRDRIDYLDAMGVSAVWLSPIHPSSSYHGYDVLDYSAVNPDFGTESDLKGFIDDAHSHGIKVYQGDMCEYEGVELANDTSIVVDTDPFRGVNFSGYVENIGDDHVSMKIKVKQKSDGATLLFVRGDGTCLTPSDVYSLSYYVLPGDVIGFAALCEPDDWSVAADYEAVYTFYTEEYPEDTVAVNVTFRYVPEKQ